MAATSVFAAGKTALITGGASGIGLATAKLCLKHGMKVAIADYNDDYLALSSKSLSESGASVSTHKLDVSKPNQWADLKKEVSSKFGGTPDLLMLNAGMMAKGSWGDADYFHKILDTNLFGVVNGLNAFVPDMQQANKSPSAIVITGSKQGITNPPGNPAYNASKAAVKSLAEHLSWDLRSTNISVHLLVPGWTFTGLSGNAPSEKAAAEKPSGAWWPEQVADYLYKKMGEGKFYVLCPDDDVSVETDKKRMMWTVGDVVYERPPLTRWRDEYKDEAQKWMDAQKF